VFYVLPESTATGTGENAIHPMAARVSPYGPVDEWSFHVILVIENRVLDLDFTNKPEITNLQDYFGRMFYKGPKAVGVARAPLFIRSIPALDYLHSYTGNWSWYLNESEASYPAVDVETQIGATPIF